VKKSWDLLAIAEALMRSPAAPYHEGFVAATVQTICADLGLELEQDRHGNFLAKLQTDPHTRPLVLAAHMDHPGFEIQKQASASVCKAKFLGGVGDAYFKHGIPVLLHPGKIPGKLRKNVSLKNRLFEIESEFPLLDPPEFAVWDLEEFRFEAGLIHGRVCDDLIGVAAALSAMGQLKRSRKKVNVIAAITRAEEVGFHGALALADSGKIPKRALLISLETSRELPPVKMGDGVIVRVGDRSSIFDSAGSRFLTEAGNKLAKRRKSFKLQRALMSGGSCEGTAYQELGFQTAAVCVALGNYHNCGPNEQIAAEFVSYFDAMSMTELLAAAAVEMPRFDLHAGKLTERIEKLRKEALAELPKRPLMPTMVENED
jgi:endoglucanase